MADSAVATLFLGLAAAAFFVPLFAGPADMPGHSDTLFNMYILEHVTRWLQGDVPSLVSPGFYWPYPLTLAFSDTHFLSVPFYAVPRWLGLTPETAYKVWFTTAYSLTFLAAHIALRLIGLRPVLAGLGAFAFAFSLPALSQIIHAQLGWGAGIPFAFLFMLRYVGPAGRPADLLAFVAAIALQILFNIYLGLFALLLCAILFACALALKHGWHVASWLKGLTSVLTDLRHPDGAGRGLAVFTLICVLACIALLAFHGYTAIVYGFGRRWGEIAPMVPRWQSYLMMDALPYWAPLSQMLPDLPMRHEHQLFIGVPLTALLLVALATLKRAALTTRLMLLTSLASLVLFMSVSGISAYYLIAQLPGFSALRAVSRYELVLLFPICVAAMLTLQGLARHFRLGHALTLAMAIWMVADVALFRREAYDSSPVRARIDTLVAETRARQSSPENVLAYGKGEPLNRHTYRQMIAMWAALESGIPSLNGYSGNYPPGGGNDNCSWFVHQLARYDVWAKARSRTRLADLNYNVIPVRLRPCDLSAGSVLALDAANLPASILDADAIAPSPTAEPTEGADDR